MSISSYYKKQSRLLEEQRQEREVLLAHGVVVEDIDDLHQSDYKVCKGERNYQLHTCSLNELADIDEDTLAGMLCPQSDDPFDSVGGFLEQIENEKLFHALKALKQADLELVEAVLVNGTQISEYASDIGVTKQTIKARLNRILEKLQKP